MSHDNVNNDDSLFKKAVIVNDNSGELKTQTTIDLTSWDTSKMEGYVAGAPVKTGHSCKIATLKPNKKYPKARVDIDPSNRELREAIFEMYEVYDKIIEEVQN